MATLAGLSLAPVLTVGVTGHRRLAAPDIVERACADVLARLGQVLEEAPCERSGRLLSLSPMRGRVISPLAEGADRIVAEAGLTAGWGLQCPLPFDRDEYERDFETTDSRLAYRALLARAEAVFELDGRVDDREPAYAEVGDLVRRQSDLLIAVWDGERSHGVGGTAEIVEQALEAKQVIVLIDPAREVAPVLISGAFARLRREPLDTMAARLASVLRPPATPQDEREDGFSRLAGERLGAAQDEGGAGQGGRHDWLELYHRADRLAGRYALLYRRTFLVNFALSAVAVTFALLSGAEAVKSVWPLILEIACIASIIGLTSLARSAAWHQRWIEYRHLAEQLRPLDLLSTLGVVIPEWRPSGYARMSDRSSAWVDWLTARAVRALGLRDARLTPDALRSVRDRLASELDGQLAYHRKMALRYRHAERRLQGIGTALFGLSGMVCAIHLLQLVKHGPLFGMTGLEGPLLTVLAGALPAAGAAVLGIRNVGEYSRLTRRSSATFDALSEERALLVALPEPLDSVELGVRMKSAILSMMTETADWRSVVITRGIELPG